MNISFIGVLTLPLKFNNLLKLLINLLLVFLPSMLAAFSIGIEDKLFMIMHSISLIIVSGYIWSVFQLQLENDEKKLPEWNFVNNFFTGIKGTLFFLLSLALFISMLFVFWLFLYFMPESKDIIYFLALIWFIYSALFYYPISMGLFAQDYNPRAALMFSTVFQILSGCWLYYLIALIYMVGYIFIIGVVGWSFITLFGINSIIFITELLGIYTLIVIFYFYANVFKSLRNEFENYF